MQRWWILTALGAMVAGGPVLGGPAEDERVTAQEQRIRALELQLEAVHRELQELKRQQAQRPPAAPAAPAPAAPRTPSRVTAEPYGYLQSQFETTPEAGYRSRVRRARLGLRGQLERNIRYQVQGDFVASTGILRDAFIQWDGWKGQHVRFGQFKVPFGFEGVESSTRIPTIERSFATEQIYHERDAGLMIASETSPEQVFGYAASVVNGGGRNQFAASRRSAVFARVALKNPQHRPVLGGQLSAGLSTQQGHVTNLAVGREGRPEDEAYGTDLTFTRGPWLLRGEWLRGRSDASVRKGWYGLTLYRLSPRWEALGRYEGYGEENGGGSAHRTTLGLNYTLSAATRLMLNYEFINGRPPEETASGLRLRLQTLFP